MKIRLFAAKYKIAITLLLSATFILIFLKNLADRSDSKNLALSFSAIYKDRLVVEGYLFEMANLLHDKKAAIRNSTSTEEAMPIAILRKADVGINKLINDYGRTNFTDEEVNVFSQFKKEFSKIIEFERRAESPADINQLLQHYENANRHLQTLSGIQLAEAGKLNRQSQQIFSGSSILTELEFVSLIIGCIAIQLLLATGRERTKFPFNPGMN